ncbi:hypothetical protein JHK87_006541 [Glycine soja]|nr:hypothetical protein JHK87_006541 [Glycine soja]
MERRHEEELTKIKDDHDQLEAYVTPLTTNCTMILEESFNLEEQDLEDIKRSNIGIGKQTEEKWKNEADKDSGMSDNLHQNRNPHSTSKFQRLEVSPNTVNPDAGPLLSFTGKGVETRGYADLMTPFSQGKLTRSLTIKYLLVDTDTLYFALIGRKTLNELGGIVSTPHLTMTFLALTWEIVTVKTDQKQARSAMQRA